jgi:hypothetical protein
LRHCDWRLNCAVRARVNGCARLEATKVTKWCHERLCPHLQIIQDWPNAHRQDRRWEIVEMLEVRGNSCQTKDQTNIILDSLPDQPSSLVLK